MHRSSVHSTISSDPLDRFVPMPYNMGVINGAAMSSTECVLGIVIDVCTRSFLLLGDEGNERMVECDTVEEFMNVLDFATAFLEPDQIEYAELAVAE